MKKKTTKKLTLPWKKILIGIVASLLGIVVIGFLSLFLWMKTWKTYEFPDGSGSIRYPGIWRDEKFEDHGSYQWLFTTFSDSKNNLPYASNRDWHTEFSISRFAPDSGSTAEESLQRSLPLTDVFKQNVIIAGHKMNMDISDNFVSYSTASKNYIYTFSLVLKNLSKFEINLNHFLLSLVVRTVSFK
jgi:hypothetical protein